MAYEPLGGSPPNATTPVLHAPQQVAQMYSMHVEEEKSYGDAGVALPVVQQLALQATGMSSETHMQTLARSATLLLCSPGAPSVCHIARISPYAFRYPI